MEFKTLTTLLCLFVLSGCTTTQNTRLSADFNISIYNSIKEQYVERATEIILEGEGEDSILYVGVEKYDSSYGKKEWLSFTKDSALESIILIDKYLSWEKIASERGDQIEKEIGRVGTPSGQFGELLFSFYSGNKNNHYLNIYGTATTYSHMYKKSDATRLRNTLERFALGNLHHLDVDSVYN